MRPKGTDGLEKLISELSALRNHLAMNDAGIDAAGVLEQVGPVVNNWANALGGGAPAHSAPPAAGGSVKCPHCNAALKITVG